MPASPTAAPPTASTPAAPTSTPELPDFGSTQSVFTPREVAFLKALGKKPDSTGSFTFEEDDEAEGALYQAREICGLEEGALSSYDGPPTVDVIIESGQMSQSELATAFKHLCPKYLPVWRKARGGFTDGTYEVGKEVKPGTYRTTRRATDCYWERSTGGGATIANDFVSNAPRGVTVTIRRGEGFKSTGCGNWRRI